MHAPDTPPRPLFDQPLSRVGEGSVPHEEGSDVWVYGFAYLVDGVRYVWPTYAVTGADFATRTEVPVPDEVAGCPYDTDQRRLITELGERDRIVWEIRRQVELDEQRSKARDLRAMELAKGDAILANAIRWHMGFEDGDASDPWMVEGIPFYQVGRNASHAFYVGAKDGQRYVIGQDYEDHDPPRVDAVETWDGGYYGHC